MTLIKNEVSVQKVISYLNDSFFPLVDKPKPSGVAPGFEKKPQKPNQGFEL
ncbi:hypothetical protein LEP1GSC132_4484 [Leptospira kirschneri str. 200803703]|uniref:Uncharacterized protein n=1 Tax=Leptospira kirschneri str. 200802841 TaxID=1193047 RepID=A0A828XU31_9LEPT|nr:hypothetical protein [Leptospira kirschneri]EKO50796.1 hypothetical protein LEP1GSC131_3259 [Leptospira kirschneri str. 200802841]EMO68240.1 hypothetical protein LEP1GSC132_4484 [Leptospira kirschneri str. 200803703]EMO74224.1 hypothetical protein LEP1GSC127_3366 [Leptospira kirschneri str. 200801925]